MRRALIALVFAGCGYRALYAYPAGERLHVALVRVAIPNSAAGQEVLTGATEELAKQGALASGDGYPRLEIEVTGANETSEGIEVSLSGRGGSSGPNDVSKTPTARATNVAIVVHAWIVRAKGKDPERDTGDMRAEDLVSTTGNDPVTADFVYQDAQRAVARRLGHKLAARAIGDPSISEGIGR